MSDFPMQLLFQIQHSHPQCLKLPHFSLCMWLEDLTMKSVLETLFVENASNAHKIFSYKLDTSEPHWQAWF